MTPTNPLNPSSSNDKWKRIIIGILGLIMAGYLLSHAFSGLKERWNDTNSPGQSAPR